MKLEDLKLNPELANKLENEHLENLLAQGIETLDAEQLAISNGLRAIYKLDYINKHIKWALEYLENNSSEAITSSLNTIYLMKNQGLEMLKESEPYLSNYLANLE